MNTPFTSDHRLILSTLGLGVVAVMVAYLFSGMASLLVAGTLCVLLWLFRPLLMPPGYGATKIRTLSVLGIFGLASSYGFWSPVIDAAAKAFAASPIVREVAPWIGEVDLGSESSIVVLIFAVAGLWIVNHYMADKSIAGGHPVPINTDFPEESFQKKLDSFDEIPELLDVNEESWLLNALSDVLSRFVSSNPQSRGVLASRVFRRPTQAFLAQKILKIRPLSEERIIQALGRFPAFTQALQVALFRDRLDLIDEGWWSRAGCVHHHPPESRTAARRCVGAMEVDKHRMGYSVGVDGRDHSYGNIMENWLKRPLLHPRSPHVQTHRSDQPHGATGHCYHPQLPPHEPLALNLRPPARSAKSHGYWGVAAGLPDLRLCRPGAHRVGQAGRTLAEARSVRRIGENGDAFRMRRRVIQGGQVTGARIQVTKASPQERE